MRVRLAIAGLGNCANSLIQGLHYYAGATADDPIPGLMHPAIAGVLPSSVDVVAAFDVDADKVGLDVADAMWGGQNETWRFCDVPPLGVTVQRGPTLDGFGSYYRDTCEESYEPPVDVASVLREREVDVLVNYVPVGSERAAQHYAEAALKAGVAFVNAMPVFIASNPEWAQRFTDAGLPVVGDDVKSQLGATISHRVLARLFEERGVRITRTSQLNVGGNMDFKNMLERSRLQSKKVSKTQAVTSNFARTLHPDQVHVGPSDHVAFLNDTKWAYVHIEGEGFGGAPVKLEYKLEVCDSPNSAGVIIDALRLAAVARQRGEGGPLYGASAYLMKSPPVQHDDDTARAMVDEWIEGR